MKFEDLLAIVEKEPVFEPGLLLAGDIEPAALQRQLTRWVAAGRLQQLRRGLYTLAARIPFLIANRLFPGSYVSLPSRSSGYGLIPEYVSLSAVGYSFF